MATDRRDNSPPPSEEELLRAMTAELRRNVGEARRALEKGLEAIQEPSICKSAQVQQRH
jgi:hypothetical protein